jgi:hypothetical protein
LIGSSSFIEGDLLWTRCSDARNLHESTNARTTPGPEFVPRRPSQQRRLSHGVSIGSSAGGCTGESGVVAVTDNVRLAGRLGWLDPLQMAATTAALTRWGPSLAALYAPRPFGTVDELRSSTIAAP